MAEYETVESFRHKAEELFPEDTEKQLEYVKARVAERELNRINEMKKISEDDSKKRYWDGKRFDVYLNPAFCGEKMKIWIAPVRHISGYLFFDGDSAEELEKLLSKTWTRDEVDVVVLDFLHEKGWFPSLFA